MISKRTSSVDRINVTSVTTASTLEIGDSSQIQAFSRALAVQREHELFYDNEFDFSQFDTFNEPLILDPIIDEIAFETIALNPIIKVNHIEIIGISTSSLLHVGNSRNIFMESRIKHIRHLRDND
ncbi:spore germination protein GerPE [Bacillaceae bacterium CLA-AA-H227]|uniref:Spore germination protein GerPE n=1 Tax=Robertmurraya yapensis (ex Hitch et al 2024) TaxID=3133160 RepID=A0ACC6S6J8_9BACI